MHSCAHPACTCWHAVCSSALVQVHCSAVRLCTEVSALVYEHGGRAHPAHTTRAGNLHAQRLVHWCTCTEVVHVSALVQLWQCTHVHALCALMCTTFTRVNSKRQDTSIMAWCIMILEDLRWQLTQMNGEELLSVICLVQVCICMWKLVYKRPSSHPYIVSCYLPFYGTMSSGVIS